MSILVVALGVCGAGVAFARWQASTPLAAASLRSARVVLTADGVASATLAPLAVTPVLGTTVTVHRALTMHNAGDVALTYRLQDVSATSSPTDLVTVGLALRVASVADVAACTGTDPGTAIALTTGTAVLDAAFVASRSLSSQASETLCVSLTVPEPRAATFRQGTATLTMSFLGRTP